MHQVYIRIGVRYIVRYNHYSVTHLPLRCLMFYMSSNRRVGAVEDHHPLSVGNNLCSPCEAGTVKTELRNPNNCFARHSPASHQKLNPPHPPSIANTVIRRSTSWPQLHIVDERAW